MALEIIGERAEQIGVASQDVAGEAVAAYARVKGSKRDSKLTDKERIDAGMAAYESTLTSIGEFYGVGQATWAGNATLEESARNLFGDPRRIIPRLGNPLAISEAVGEMVGAFRSDVTRKIGYGLEGQTDALRRELQERYGVDPSKVPNLDSIIAVYGQVNQAQRTLDAYKA